MKSTPHSPACQSACTIGWIKAVIFILLFGVAFLQNPLRLQAAISCTTDANCNDGNACTLDSCITFSCEHTFDCSFSDACCNDGNACTIDTCNPSGSSCANTFFCINDACCNDGNSCTIDVCSIAAGTCTNTFDCSGSDACCSDGNPCTIDTCNPSGISCANTFFCINDACCNDGNSCTIDVCSIAAGTCTNTFDCSGSDLCCSDGNPCTIDTCNPSGISCANTFFCINDACCNDGSSCTVDVCNVAAGTCTNTFNCGGGNDACCNDGNPCTIDGCDMSGVYCAYGSFVCDDGDACNGVETCNPAGGCNPGTPPPPCNDGNACNGVETCNPAGGCFPGTPPPPCSDGNACNGVETCNPAGGCNPGTPPPPCNDGNACNGVETCNPAGGCNPGTPPPPCSDNNACNGVETCNPAGGCFPGTPPACDDFNECNGVETCDPSLGCVPGAPLICDDGNACNGVETCDETFGCEPGSQLLCNDFNVCNGLETCNPASGCVAGTPLTCNDGNACNGLETCNPASGCVPGTPPVCNDGDACNGLETCNPASGCQAGIPMNCNDNNPCTLDGCSSNNCTHTNFTGVGSLTLVNSSTDSDIRQLHNQDTINLFCTPNVNVRADVCPPVGSVKFLLNNVTVKIENIAPYAIAGDNGGNYNDWNINPGDYTLTAIPYSGANASGSAGNSKTITLHIINQPATCAPCSTHVQCADNSACTLDSCLSGQCSYTPKNCNDGNACTIDVCDANGSCVHSAINCSDNNLCTSDGCNPNSGCVNTPTNCTDASQCTNDFCNPNNGACVNAPITCNDNDPCTQNQCNPATGCEFPPIPNCCTQNAQCNDGNPCTFNVCSNNICTFPVNNNCCTTDAQCNDNIGCTKDDCTPNNVCTNTDTCCGLGVTSFTLVNAATDADVRQLGSPDTVNRFCLPSFSVRANVCTHPGSVKFFLNNALIQTENSAPYAVAGDNSGNYNNWNIGPGNYSLKATAYSGANGTGTVGGSYTINLVIQNQQANCAPACTTGTQCSDNNLCTTDICTNGVCSHGATCTDGDACTTDQCNPNNGSCLFPPVNCDDGNVCTGVEYCNPAGGCTQGTPLTCSDGNACNGVESCNPQNGCVLGTPPICNDNNSCTTDACVAPNGCVFTPTGNCCTTNPQCNDNNICTQDVCNNGTCVYSVAQRVVTSFTLVDANSDADIGPLQNGDTIFLGSTPSVNVRANLCTDAGTSSVRFTVNGPVFRIENSIPYSLAGDAPPGDYHQWNVNPGNYSINATPFSAANATGTMGTGLTINIVVSGAASKMGSEEANALNSESRQMQLSAYPNPFSEEVNIEFTLLHDARVRLEIVNLEGRVVSVVFDGTAKANEKQMHQFNAGTLANGMYFYRLITEDGEIQNRKLLLAR